MKARVFIIKKRNKRGKSHSYYVIGTNGVTTGIFGKFTTYSEAVKKKEQIKKRFGL